MADKKEADVKKPLTKNQIIAVIAEGTSLPKTSVSAVIDALSEEIKKSLGKKGAGSFILPGILKVSKKKVKAQPAKKGIVNPLTGKTYDRPAKPAHDVVKVKALKALKESV
ncbi:MAG: HU family DNA-binding protein [Planctomycetaceae bacterium]|nr:HU family DNA-binding protein [Planctomycetaceae bacterium]